MYVVRLFLEASNSYRVFCTVVGGTVAETIAAAATTTGEGVAALQGVPTSVPIATEAVEYDEVEGGSEECTGQDSMDVVPWNPIYWMTTWTDRVFRERYTVVVLLPSGISSQKHYEVRVADNSREIELKVSWPSLLYMVNDLGRACGKHKMSEAKEIAMGLMISEMQKRLVSAQTFHSSCSIQLGREIESDASVRAIGDVEGTRLLLIDLVIKGEYGGKLETGDFVILSSK